MQLVREEQYQQMKILILSKRFYTGKGLVGDRFLYQSSKVDDVPGFDCVPVRDELVGQVYSHGLDGYVLSTAVHANQMIVHCRADHGHMI
jgi:hypothetical protein